MIGPIDIRVTPEEYRLRWWKANLSLLNQTFTLKELRDEVKN